MESATAAAGSEDRGEIVVDDGYGKSPLRSAILGSTPHRLLHGPRQPVIVVPVASRE